MRHRRRRNRWRGFRRRRHLGYGRWFFGRIRQRIGRRDLTRVGLVLLGHIVSRDQTEQKDRARQADQSKQNQKAATPLDFESHPVQSLTSAPERSPRATPDRLQSHL